VNSIALSPAEAKLVAQSFDAIFKQGCKDAYGDFTLKDNVALELGIGSCLQYDTSVWEYVPTKHPEDDSKQYKFTVVTLPVGTQVRVMPESSGIKY
jgi:hypothetical protein